jgi:hypothetical protein
LIHAKDLEGLDRFLAEADEYLQRHPSDRDLAEAAGDSRDAEALPLAALDTWQAGICHMPMWITESSEPYRPWGMFLTDPADDAVLSQHITAQEPSVREFVGHVLTTMRQPAVGEPRRPGKIEVRPGPHADALGKALESLGIEVVTCNSLDHVDHVLRKLEEHCAGPTSLRPLVDVPGLTEPQQAGFYEAAAVFYRNRPWRQIPGDTVIEVKSSGFSSGPWYAVVMGQSGMTLGLALYEDREALARVLRGDDSSDESMRRISSLSVLYNECFEIPVSDLDAIEKNAWPVADDEAYPTAMRVNPGLAIRPPLKWELHLLEGCLLAIPKFLQSKVSHETQSVTTSLGPLTLELTREAR